MSTAQYQSSPEAVGIDLEKLEALRARARQEVDAGLLPSAQIAIARKGRLCHFETFGEADNSSLYCIFSATKAITSAAAWLLIQEGRLDITQPVAGIIPEFGDNEKAEITIEQLFLHTAGFPHAPFRVEDWNDKQRRMERFASWRLGWAPGSRYEYHPTSSMWVIGELIERISGSRYEDFIRERIAAPLALDDLRVGTPEDQQAHVTHISHHGDALTEADYQELGLPVPPVTEKCDTTDHTSGSPSRITQLSLTVMSIISLLPSAVVQLALPVPICDEQSPRSLIGGPGKNTAWKSALPS